MTNSSKNVVGLFHSGFNQALQAWQKVLSPDYIVLGSELSRYDNCPSQTKRRIAAALMPQSTEQIQDIVAIANKYKIPLYPISTGKNWGYGGANPIVDDCVIIDLGHMNRILDFDSDLGIITIEPGVTQGEIATYLKRNNYPYMISPIVAGPNCSYLANALERGFGMIPPRDRFLSMTSLKAVLPDGSFYQSLISDAGGQEIDKVYKWGVGPYLDGLFSQGNFGIVTQASFALARVPEQITRYYCSPRPDVPLEDLIEHFREAKQVLGNVINSIELGNRISDTYQCGESQKPNEFDFSNWVAYGSLHATKRITRAVIKDMKRILKPAFNDFVFITAEDVDKAEKRPYLYKKSPNWRRVVDNIPMMRSFAELARGMPDIEHLNYAYTFKNIEVSSENLEDKLKEIGFLSFRPILPLTGKDARLFTHMLGDLCSEYNMYPGMTITAASETHIIFWVDIFFEVKDKGKAEQFHHDLFEKSKGLGYLPYRAHIDSLPWFTDVEKSQYYKVVNDLKSALDPNNIMAPGRFTKT